MLFKVLDTQGHACHGGSGSWPLPQGKRPGKWYEYEGEPQVCERGLHLVRDPLPWYKKGSRLFVAEADLTASISYDGSEKAAFKRARLLYEVTPGWPLLPMFPTIRVYLAMLTPDAGGQEGANLSGANLCGANLSRANLSRADLSGADLAGANLYRANLSEADLSSADLYGANLSRADLSGADLSGADPYRADLSRANLYGADLSRADLSGANLSGAYRGIGGAPAGWRINASGLLVRSAVHEK